MKLFHRKSRMERLLEMAEDLLDVPKPSKLGLPGSGSDNALKVRLPKGKELQANLNQETAVRAGVIASGLAGLTAGSASISALRRRKQGAGDGS
ncbi:MAG: hypothetical protein JOY58_10790 [Solirubrobacterales bacterium]|nr:hypothetical protein [Solirubrobacterales bacterium]